LDTEEPVFVIDLTAGAIEEAAARSSETTERAPPPSALPERPAKPIGQVALLIDGWPEPLVLALAPTSEVELLDALGRLLKIAVLSGERVPAVAVNYGDELERRLAFERRLPEWVYEGIDEGIARKLPPAVRKVLGPK
jgi:hypothetical protein